jgi:hypothetical protein
MIPATTTRVERNTDVAVNQRIQEQTHRNIARFAGKGTDEINRRLRELNREWDVERVLETNAASVALLGLGLGAFVDRRFFVLPAIVAGFLLQHAIQGWCPPVPMFRRMGVRTAREIDSERYALKIIRGDFESLSARQVPLGEAEIARIVSAVNR